MTPLLIVGVAMFLVGIVGSLILIFLWAISVFVREHK